MKKAKIIFICGGIVVIILLLLDLPTIIGKVKLWSSGIGGENGDSVDSIEVHQQKTPTEVSISNKDSVESEQSSMTATQESDSTLRVSQTIQTLLDSAVIYHIKPSSNIIHTDCKVGITIDGKVIEKQLFDDYIDYITAIPSIERVEIVFSDKISVKDEKIIMFYIKEIRR